LPARSLTSFYAGCNNNGSITGIEKDLKIKFKNCENQYKSDLLFKKKAEIEN